MEKENVMADVEAQGNKASSGDAGGLEGLPGKGGREGLGEALALAGGEGQGVVAVADKPANNGEDIKSALAAKISNLQEKQGEDDKALARLYKKAAKDLKEQLEALGGNSEEKVKMLQTKLLEKIHECNKLDRAYQTQKRSLENATRDKDSAVGELARANTMKKKLENLCKELQKQNKIILDQSKLATEQEQDRRKELSDKFSESIRDVQSKMDVQDSERLKQAEENDKLREQLKSFISQYEVRDKHFEHEKHAMDLECQLANAKLKQAEELRNQAMQQAEIYKEKALELAASEQSQRQQLASYGDKFKEFQETLTKSNEVFATFKKDSERTQKQIKQLNKERKDAVMRAERAEKLCEQATESMEAAKKEMGGLRKQKERMEALCRTLTAERLQLKERLGEGGGEGGGGEKEAAAEVVEAQ